MLNQAYQLPFERVGNDVVIWPQAKIVGSELVSIGDSVIVDDFVLLIAGTRTQIGSFVHIAAFTSIMGGGEFVIRDFAGLSGGVRVYTGNEDYLGGCLTNPTVPYPYRVPVRSFVRIERHAIVGANSVILPGVTIGEGAVVGANSLVVRDCASWTVNVGSPARAIRERSSDRIFELEARLRNELYDSDGNYIPKRQRVPPAPHGDNDAE